MFGAALDRLGLGAWHAELAPLLAQRVTDAAHGDMPAWRRAVDTLPDVASRAAILDADTVQILQPRLDDATRAAVRAALLALAPWRKGPFDVGGVHIDSEWRCDWKWRRLQQAIAPLAGRRVLDVGSGNGYYTLRMLGAGASAVLGIDPTLLYVMQYRALQRFLPPLAAAVLPLRLRELPPASRAFDSTFSMGVLYHQRSPLAHLRELRDTLRAGGELVLETLVLPGDSAFARTPADRYARMRNVWLVPTVPELRVWLERSGFRELRVIDTTRTTPAEQRRTAWMPFDSLADALCTTDSCRTIEGLPAPLRAIVVAQAP